MLQTQTAIINSWFGLRANTASIASILYDTHKTGPTINFNQAELRTFTMAVPPNIMDYSAFGSLQNNVINFNWNSTDYSAVLTQGSYDASGLTIAIAAVMNAVTSTSNFAAAYDVNLAKFRIYTNDLSNFSLDFTANTTPWVEFGFGQTTYTGANSYISPYQVNLTWSSYILIHIRELDGACINICNKMPATFGVPVTKAGTMVQGWDYLRNGPIHKQRYTTDKQLTSMTIDLYFIRGGGLYPIVGDANFEYTLDLKFKHKC